jgi:membrane protein required for colicin V production
MTWDWVDLAIIGVIALSVITGLIRGFVKELVALCVWVIAIWVAFRYSQTIDPWLQKYIQDKTIRTIAAFILVLIATLIVGAIVNAILGYVLKRTGLSGTDRLLGMGFGFVRGVFIVALILAVVKLTALPYQQYASQSQLYSKFDPVVDWICGFMPDFIKKAKEIDPKKNLVDFQGEIKGTDVAPKP